MNARYTSMEYHLVLKKRKFSIVSTVNIITKKKQQAIINDNGFKILRKLDVKQNKNKDI